MARRLKSKSIVARLEKHQAALTTIELKQVFLDKLTPQYDAMNNELRSIAETMGEIEQALV